MRWDVRGSCKAENKLLRDNGIIVRSRPLTVDTRRYKESAQLLQKISCGDENTGVSPPNITDACFFKQPCVGKKGSGGPVDPLTGFSQAQFTSKDSLGRWTSDCLRRQDCRTDFSEWKCYVEEACNTSTTRHPPMPLGYQALSIRAYQRQTPRHFLRTPSPAKFNQRSHAQPRVSRVSPSMLTMVAMSIFYSIH